MPSARLRIRRKSSPLKVILPAARFVAIASLLIAVVTGGYRYITRPYEAGALEFSPHLILPETGIAGVLDVAASDIDDDGDIDVVTSGLDGVKAYIKTDDGVWEQKVIDDKRAERVQIIELNGDSREDLLVTLHGDNSVRWYRNDGNFEFSGFLIDSGADAAAYAGDIDADGDNDVVSATGTGDQITLRRWMNDGNGAFTSTTLDADSNVSAISIGDLDGNGYNDIVTGGERGLQLWDTNDGVTWTREDIDESNENRTWIAIKDVNGDGRLDIATADQVDNEIAYYQNIQHSEYSKNILEDSVDATTVRIIDLDEDGDEDFVVAAQDDNSIFWFDNNGSQSFTKRTLASNLQTVLSVEVIDVDGDDDFDFIAGDHYRGTVRWYERTRAKPTATKPTDIAQSTDTSGRVTFTSTFSDADRDTTRVRVQYSFDGEHWYKPWLTSVTADNGTVDLKNSNGYQVGTTNPINTDAYNAVKLTFTWDTKSVENTGGPVVGDVSTVQLRLIPRDSTGNGAAAVSSQIRVDNAPPANVGNLRISSINDEEAVLAWNQASDSSSFEYKIYYGTNHAAVLEQRSDVWDITKDADLADIESTGTTVTGLEADKTYTFKLFAVDQYGNQTAAPSVRGVSVSAPDPTPTPAPVASSTPAPSTTPAPDGSSEPTVEPTPGVESPTPEPTATIEPSPTPDLIATPPPTTFQNASPVADAGIDQVVNPSALVVLDGTASFDADEDSLTYTWSQLSGPNVELFSERTANASFSAGLENETYVFALTVRDPNGATASDQVTIATRQLPRASTAPVDIVSSVPPTPSEVDTSAGEDVFLLSILQPIDWLFFGLSLLSTALLLIERMVRSFSGRQSKGAGGGKSMTGKVVHFKTDKPIGGAQVLIYGDDGKLRATERTNDKGEFPAVFPRGRYTISVKAQGFAFSPATSRSLRPESGIVYSGGKITVTDGNKPLEIVIPMKPTGAKVTSLRTQFLHIWQIVQRLGRVLSWPIFIIGALLNTVLIFLAPSGLYLLIEVLYVLLVIIKVALELRVRPAYGLVRDAITHVPLDLAVVRLFEHGTNRVVMTRVTDGQGRFFALPPSGTYTVTVTKPGYAVFSKEDVKIESEQDSVLQITADLMPVVPKSGLRQAKAAVL